MAIVLNPDAGVTTPSPVVLEGSTSGTVTLAAPAVSGSSVITFPAGTGTVAVNGVSGVLVSGTSQTAPFTAPNTACEFTGIPSWAKRITVMLSGVSLSGTASYILQVGSGSFATTGYNSGATSVSTATTNTTNGSGATNITDSIFLGGYANTAGSLVYGQVILTNVTGNTWVASGVSYSDGADRVATAAGNVVLSGTLDRVRISTNNGTDTFDAGTINIMWE